MTSSAEAGRFKHVAAALHTTVPIKTSSGALAIRPVAHSEIVVEVDASRVRRGDRFSGKVKGYQGVPFTGFFPLANSENSDRSGKTTAGRIVAAVVVALAATVVVAAVLD